MEYHRKPRLAAVRTPRSDRTEATAAGCLVAIIGAGAVGVLGMVAVFGYAIVKLVNHFTS